MHIAIVTAGGAGMFCGSCMHDNTWARALQAQGAEVSLIPTYTPLRVDEQDLSVHDVYLGGINVYMEFRSRLWRRLPRALTRWLDTPWIINLASRFGVSNDAIDLGALTLAMLDGEAGPQRREIEELVDFISGQLKPDVVCFSNALLSGTIRTLKQKFDGPVFCVLQGDDVFLEDLPEPFRTQAIGKIHERTMEVDGFLVHSRYYRDFMAHYLDLPVEKFHQIPLGIDLDGHDGQPGIRDDGNFTVGYFARICPEKGLDQLAEAFRILHAKHPQTRLKAGGYLGKRDDAYFHKTAKRMRDLGTAFEYIGSPSTRQEKIEFYKSLDVLSVPTAYHEPKGIYVLEALANGVPVVQPRHGAFPELLESTGGGVTVEPENPEDLARALEDLMLDSSRRLELAKTGQANVRSKYDPETMAIRSLDVFREATLSPR